MVKSSIFTFRGFFNVFVVFAKIERYRSSNVKPRMSTEFLNIFLKIVELQLLQLQLEQFQ